MSGMGQTAMYFALPEVGELGLNVSRFDECL